MRIVDTMGLFNFVNVAKQRPYASLWDVRCHGNICYRHLIVIKFYVSDRSVNKYQWEEFGVNRIQIDNFTYPKKSDILFDVT
jgi:hypothetical protein